MAGSNAGHFIWYLPLVAILATGPINRRRCSHVFAEAMLVQAGSPSPYLNLVLFNSETGIKYAWQGSYEYRLLLCFHACQSVLVIFRLWIGVSDPFP